MKCTLNLFKFAIKLNLSRISTKDMSKHCKNSTCHKKNRGLNVKNTLKKVPLKPPYEILTAPIKSESDKKEYKVIRLANGLTACLISDTSPIDPEELMDTESESEEESEGSGSESEMEESEEDESDNEGADSKGPEQKLAAAALCIGVGSFSDPKEVPGMAHFLEHMVFMGSKKFPEENDFDAFIKKSGGSDNAATDFETTVFYFECLEKHFFQALDKFAQFFIAPLMKKDAIAREREAIESEFQMALPSDSSRRDQLMYSLAKENSPVNSFSWGNLITLRDNIEDDKLYKGVHEFRKRHYSSHRMTLAVQARLPLETLQEYVLKCFAKVPNNKLPPDDFSEFSTDIFNTPQFKRIYYIKSTKNLFQVELTWALPSLKKHYKSKPDEYISMLLGDEGKGSILSYLRRKIWALTVSAGISNQGSEHSSLYAFYKVVMSVTEEGLDHINEIIETVYAYINLLKKVGPEERTFDEFSKIAETSFRFTTEETAADNVENLCEEMQNYPSQDYLRGPEMYYEYDPELIKTVLNYLTPDNMCVMILLKNIPDDIKLDKKEKWFGTEYTDREIPPEWMSNWRNVEPYEDLALPQPNPYLTTDFSILPEKPHHPSYPVKVSESSLYELWYRQDQKFKLPIAYYYIYLISPLIYESAENACMLQMLPSLLEIAVTEELYPAQNADLSYQFTFGEKGVVFKVSGYNEKLPILVGNISKYIVKNEWKEELFNAVKDNFRKYYYNLVIKPSKLAGDVRLKILVNNTWTAAEKYNALKKIDFEMWKEFINKYFQCVYAKCLVQGNVTEEMAVETTRKFIDDLRITELPKDQYPSFRVIQLPQGEQFCRINNFNKKDANSMIVNYYQSKPFSFHESVIIELLMFIIEEPVFDILRTKEQLGYNVSCSIRDTFGVLGFSITVNAQATKHTVQHVNERIEAFISHVKGLLDEFTEEEFEETKSALTRIKQCVDVHLREEVNRNWHEIVTDDYLFDRLSTEIKEIATIQLDEVKKWWTEHNMFANKEDFRKLSIQVVGFNTKEQSESLDDLPSDEEAVVTFLGPSSSEETQNFIQDIKEFKANQFLYPVITVNK